MKPTKTDLTKLITKSRDYDVYQPSAFTDKKAILRNIEVALNKSVVIVVLK